MVRLLGASLATYHRQKETPGPEPLYEREALLAHALEAILRERMTGPRARKHAAMALGLWLDALPPGVR
jgi:hypothetical protein